MDSNLITLELKDTDAFVLCELMRVKIENIISNQQALLKAVFASRYKLILASYGIKKKLFGGWQVVMPYIEDASLKTAMHDEEANWGSLQKSYMNATSLCRVFNVLITKIDYGFDEKHLQKMEELFSPHWSSLAKTMSFHGHTKTPEEWQEYYQSVYAKWFHAEQAFKRKHFGY